MCGRYTIASVPEVLRVLFGYVEQPNFPPRYNVAPTQPVPVVRLIDGQRRFALLRWGFMPAWVKDPKTFSLVINARGETIGEKPAFRNAIRRRRCLLPADGFYEWQRGTAGKRPFFIRQTSRQPFAFGGLWETWSGPNGEEVDTVAIVTTTANATLRPIHDRMPVIVSPRAFDLWLDPHAEPKHVTALIAPAANDLLEAHEVSDAVNRVANDGPSLIAPFDSAAAPPAPPKPPRRVKKPVDDGQGSLF